MKIEWSDDAWLAVSELYRRYGSSLPGSRENILVQAIASVFSLPSDSVYKRLANFAARDPGNVNKGLFGGGPDKKYHTYLLLPKRNNSYKQQVKTLRAKYPQLKGVI